MKAKAKKLTPAERHARFKELAREVEAEGEAPDFDETVKRLAEQPKETIEGDLPVKANRPKD